MHRPRGQLQGASAYVNSNTVPLTDRYFSATYDNAANRTVVRRLGTTSAYDRTYTPNAPTNTPAGTTSPTTTPAGWRRPA
jgi:hypothetical protein